MKKYVSLLFLIALLAIFPVMSHAAEPAFSYQLELTDGGGTAVNDLHTLSNGDRLHVEIHLERTYTAESS